MSDCAPSVKNGAMEPDDGPTKEENAAAAAKENAEVGNVCRKGADCPAFNGLPFELLPALEADRKSYLGRSTDISVV